MLKVHVISREIIKPSSPTPNHLSNFKLSLLDQRAPIAYVPLIYFSIGDDGNHPISTIEKVQQLKKSLSDTLTSFYPLAGRFKEDGSVVECNDDGVEFSEARVHGQLSEFLKQPYMEVLDRLVPCSFLTSRSGWDVILAVQVNVFDCGGMAIGVSFCHRLGDAVSMGTFVNAWASTSRGETTCSPDFQSVSKLFPTEGPVAFNLSVAMDNVVTKRFLFDAPIIAALRGGPANHMKQHPSRFEAVSVLIWRCMMRACGPEDGLAKSAVAMHAVNLRGRMVPPLPDYSFGNLLVSTISVALEVEWRHADMQHDLEKKMRDATREIDIDYIKELQKPDGILRADESTMEKIGKYSNSGRDFCFFSSWSRFPFYDADFGWGRPIWVGSCCFGAKNCTIMIDTRDGDGIEAWVSMEDGDMARFEQDQELLSFLTPPSTD